MAKNQKPKTKNQKPIVSIIMGSTSDWETMKNASDILTEFDVAHESKVVSAHRTPDLFLNLQNPPNGAASKSSSRARAARRICRECALRRRFCRFSAFPFKAKLCRAWIRFYQSFKCPPEFRSELWQSETRARKTPRFLRFRFWQIHVPN